MEIVSLVGLGVLSGVIYVLWVFEKVLKRKLKEAKSLKHKK